jgi:transcriptional regulator with PAS, ATPase and Fis domain
MESEFFGYEEGAFTGARKGGKAGYFEMAEGGTLFLDEITEMPLSLQGKLLEVLQNRTYFRIGGEKKKVADVRLIAATNKNLDRLVEGHAFREDLFYRINVFSVEIPPLRQRLDSLFSMATDLLPDICHRLDVGQQILSMEALEKMTAYSWPGNIRQLENVLEKACILSDGKVILPEDIELEGDKEKKAGGEEGVGGTLKAQREDFEKKIIRETLAACQGSRIKTARILGIGKTSLFEKMRKYGIEIGGREDADLDDDFNY